MSLSEVSPKSTPSRNIVLLGSVVTRGTLAHEITLLSCLNPDGESLSHAAAYSKCAKEGHGVLGIYTD